MAADNRAFDGCTYVFGCDTGLDPSLLQPSQLAKAVNRTFRGAINRTRPPFIHRSFIYNDPTDEPIVRFGNVQGAICYRKLTAGTLDSIIASIAGNVYRFAPVSNGSFMVDSIYKGMNASVMNAWFCQAVDQLYIQNGVDNALFWNGVIPSSARPSLWPASPEMPTGNLMTYAFGRVWLADAYDQIQASDIIYGQGFTNTTNTRNFTEEQYWQGGGSFGMPTICGHITGLTTTTAQFKGNIYGQGLILAIGDTGAQGIDGSQPRSSWNDAQLQSITLQGTGCLSPYSVINVNNRTLFRNNDGLAMYQNLLVDQQYALSFAKFSQAVNGWFDKDTKSLIRYNSTVCNDNRILSTVSPALQVNATATFGNHRYHNGILSLDLDRTAEAITGQSPTVNSMLGSMTPMIWDGLWTGIRPTVLVSGTFNYQTRAFAFSFDADGENRLYEIAPQGFRHDQVNGQDTAIEWFYLTKRFDWSQTQQSNTFERKKLVGGELHISELKDRVSVSAAYRSDNRQTFQPLLADTPVGPDLTGFNFTTPRDKRIKLLTPSDKVPIGETYPLSHGLQHQIMVIGTGDVRVDRVRFAMAPGGNDPNVPVGDDPNKIDNPQTQIGVDGVFENDYQYLIIKQPSS